MTTIAEHTQSLAEFRDAATETLDRVNRTGEPEVITVDGEERAVLVSPSVYRDMVREVELAQDVGNIRIDGADCRGPVPDGRQRFSGDSTNAVGKEGGAGRK